MNKQAHQCISCQNLHTKLKVIQADYDFQIKKLNEDKSSQKALYQLNTNREIKKLQQRCQKEKEQRLKENQSWMKKYDELIEKQKLEMAQNKTEKEKEVQQFKKTKQAELQKFKFETVAKLQKTIETLTRDKETLRKQLREKHQAQIKQLASKNDQKVASLVQKHGEQMRRKSGQYEATIVGIQSEKTVEENLHRKTKQESRQSQNRLNQQIYSLKKTIYEHEHKISILRAEIQQKSQKIQNLHQEITHMQTQHTQNYQKLANDYNQKCIAHRQKMEKQLQQMFKRQFENCSKYEKALQKIQEHREMENKMYKANLNDIKSCVEERPSRLEDVEKIISLKEKLLAKQRECESLSEELKWYRLELQNKQETYNKIFGPDSKNNQSIYIRRKDLKLKRPGKSVASVRQVLGNVSSVNNLAPLVGNLQRKLIPPKQNKIL